MTILQQKLLRQSEVRQEINSLLGNDARTDEQQGELEKLTGEAQKLEPELRAALIAAPDPEVTTITGDSETRERAELRAKTGLADYLRAAAGGSAVTGAAAEYATSLGVPTVGHLPMALFGRSTPMPETRAITPGPAVDGPLAIPRPVRVRAVGSGKPRDRDAVRPERSGTDSKSDHGGA